MTRFLRTRGGEERLENENLEWEVVARGSEKLCWRKTATFPQTQAFLCALWEAENYYNKMKNEYEMWGDGWVVRWQLF